MSEVKSTVDGSFKDFDCESVVMKMTVFAINGNV